MGINVMKQEVLKQIKGTDIEKILKQYNVIKEDDI